MLGLKLGIRTKFFSDSSPEEVPEGSRWLWENGFTMQWESGISILSE